MTAFLRSLVEQMDALEEKDLLPAGINKAKKEDRVVGELNLDMRRIWTAWQRTEEQATRMAVEAMYCHDDSQAQRIEEAAFLKWEADVYRELFWAEVRKGLNIIGLETISLRKGNKVVIEKPTPVPSGMADLFPGVRGAVLLEVPLPRR